jgi:ribosomal protein S18 acetylase RimI-like enzyme
MVRIELLDQRVDGVARQIHAILVLAHAQEAALLGPGPGGTAPRSARDLRTDGGYHLGAFDGDALVGALSLAPDDEPSQIAIASLVVHPAHQRRGIARSLVGEALRRTAGTALAVTATAANLPALALYRSHGFVVYRHGSIGLGAVALVKLRHAAAQVG